MYNVPLNAYWEDNYNWEHKKEKQTPNTGILSAEHQEIRFMFEGERLTAALVVLSGSWANSFTLQLNSFTKT